MTSNRPHIIICRPDPNAPDTFALHKCSGGEWPEPAAGSKKLQAIVDTLLFKSTDPVNDAPPLAGNPSRKLPAHPAHTWPDITITPRSASVISEMRNLIADASFARRAAWPSVTILMPESEQSLDRWHQVIRQRDGFRLGPKETRFVQQRLGNAIMEYFGMGDRQKVDLHGSPLDQGGSFGRFTAQSADDPLTELWVRPDWRAVDFVPEHFAASSAATPPSSPDLKQERVNMAGLPSRPLTHTETKTIDAYFAQWKVRGFPPNPERDSAELTQLLGFHVPPKGVQIYRNLAMSRRHAARQEAKAKNRTQGEPSVSSWRP